MSLAKQSRRHLAEVNHCELIQTSGQTNSSHLNGNKHLYGSKSEYSLLFGIWKDVQLKILLISCRNSCEYSPFCEHSVVCVPFWHATRCRLQDGACNLVSFPDLMLAFQHSWYACRQDMQLVLCRRLLDEYFYSAYRALTQCVPMVAPSIQLKTGTMLSDYTRISESYSHHLYYHTAVDCLTHRSVDVLKSSSVF